MFLGSMYLQICRCPAKNSKQKLAGNAAKTPNIITEISVYTQKFPAIKYEVENIFLTSLRLIYKLKNIWIWMQKLYGKKKEIWSVRKPQE